MRGSPKGLSDEKAARMMAALRGGRTLRLFRVKAPCLEAYFKAQPEYARQALPLIEANKEAARLRRGDSLRSTTHCRAGLHLMTGDNVFMDGTHCRRRCLACRRASSAHAPLMSIEVAEKVKQALQAGASLTQITRGKPVGGGQANRSLFIASFKIIKRYRQENPDFDRFVAAAIADSISVGQRIRRQRNQNAMKREEINDYYKIRAMLPANYPDKDAVISFIIEDLLTGALKREDVPARLKFYIAAHGKFISTINFPKFGPNKLMSLDAQLFEDGTMTRGDTITRGLWD
jgi:hypothetical protein